MRYDLFALNARQAARRVSQSPATYACAVERPCDAEYPRAFWFALAAGAVAVVLSLIFN